MLPHNQFEHISLLNSSLKLLTKLLANMMQRLIQAVVHLNFLLD
jgi:hypothetical protein